MRVSRFLLPLLTLSIAVFAQSDRGTITGTISDPTGAVVANAQIEAKNAATGTVYNAASSSTGNYTLAEIPTGTYEISVTVTGFKKYNRGGVVVPVSQTVRVDAALEVGTNTESVTVSEQAPLLKTESGELSHNVSTSALDDLPVLQIGTSSTGLRDPYAMLEVIPGATWRQDGAIRVNGMPSNTEALRVEGQPANTGLWYTQSWVQPSVDAIQETAIETSNYSAEFGQAGGGVFNVTMRSGTNAFHGSAYDYLANEALNAAPVYHTVAKPRERRNDYGFTVGGPVWIPKVYDGHNRTFFFFNFEQYRETQVLSGLTTVPSLAMRTGNFSGVSQFPIGTDPATGLGVNANVIYDPNSDHIVNGADERTPFPNNTIPSNLLDPVALRIQSFLPNPSGAGANAPTNNAATFYNNPKHSMVPSLKMDQQISANSKVSVFWSRTSLNTPSNDGLPYPITSARGYDNITNTERINFDQTLRPTLLYHAGIGLVDLDYNEVVANYNVISGGNGAPGIGFTGTNDPNAFPTIGGLFSIYGGGPTGLGAFTHASVTNLKPTANTSLTWVKGNHTYKFGGELVVDGYLNTNYTYATPWVTFSPNDTSDPALYGLPLKGTAGFGYASFLMGRVDSGYSAVIAHTRLGRKALAGFAQDSWKVTRKLTLDYGLRYDFQTYLKEHTGIQPNFSPSTPNPCFGCGTGLLGGTIFEATCGCAFSHNYPFAFGPRLGVAYQAFSKTVIRAGFGISYGTTANDNFQSYAVGGNTPYAAPAFGTPAYQLANGLPPYITPATYPNFSAGQYPTLGIPANTLNFFDNNAGRPSRTTSWSFGIQRELSNDLVVEVDYVGNRGVWWQANNAAVNDNAITYAALQAHGIDITSPAGQALLNSQIGGPLAKQAGLTLPYPSFPVTQTVAQSLRPYPEYTSILRLWNPDGDTWYNALQSKLTKRFSHGLTFTSSFTWSKNEMNGAEGDANFFQVTSTAANDVFNRKIDKYLSAFDQPFVYIFSGTYTVPKPTFGFLQNKMISQVVRDWQLSALLNYSSGLPILAPVATNGLSSQLFQATYVNRVPGVDPFTVDLNCHCFNPNSTFVLNPKAWSQPGPGQFGNAAAYYNDYRQQRDPVENMSLARNFRIKERMNLQIRGEFTNIFNRVVNAAPTSTNIGAPQIANTAGRPGAGGSGFGYISGNTTVLAPRAGQLVARFTF